MKNFLLLAMVLSLGFLTGQAQVKASLVASVADIQPGKSFTVALRLEHQPHWHTYWVNAGTGYPTSLTWELPAGWTAGEIQWPVPILIKDGAGKVAGHGYDGTVLLPVTLTPPADARAGEKVTLKAKAEWLMCEEMCIPGDASLQLTLPIATGTPAADKTGSAEMANARQKLPVELPAGGTACASIEARKVILTVVVPAGDEIKAPHFFSEDGFIAYDEPQTAGGTGQQVKLILPISPDADVKAASLKGVLAFTGREGAYVGIKIDVPFRRDPQPLVSGLAPASQVGLSTVRRP